MSLLMDALKKAEAAKRQAQAVPYDATDGELSLEPTRIAPGTRAPSQPASLPALPSRLELLDDQFTTPSARAANKHTPTQAAAAIAQEKDRQAATQVFAAKTSGSQKPFHLALGLSTLAAVLAIAGYFWWQMQPRSSLIALTPGTSNATPDALGNMGSPSAGMTSAASVAAASGSAAAERSATPVDNLSTFLEAEQRKPPPLHAAATEKGRLADAAGPAQVTLTAESAIRITRSTLRVDPGVSSGYHYLQVGDLIAARQEYERALRSDPRNTDALDGLAAISLRQNRSDAAAGYYQRALEADPTDATAQAGPINLRGSGDPLQTESRLKTLVVAQPDAHSAHFALGNLYAAQGQWREAQEAYFQAYTGDPGDPDYQFNLAVSLDQLHQTKPALQYYQSALAAAGTRPAAFDSAQAQARVRDLQN